jgi:hypothetical protein
MRTRMPRECECPGNAKYAADQCDNYRLCSTHSAASQSSSAFTISLIPQSLSVSPAAKTLGYFYF